MSRPIIITLAREMPGPPDVVWELITDWEHQDDWMLEASDFVVTTPFREGVGVEAEATIRIGGIKTRDRVRVLVWDPPRRLTIEHLGWVSGSGDIALTPITDGRTLLVWKEQLLPPLGPLGAFGMRSLRPVMSRVFLRDLRVLEGLVRARS
jgi:uncharacterized protein YndB with AHSA1/START domain